MALLTELKRRLLWEIGQDRLRDDFSLAHAKGPVEAAGRPLAE